MKLQINATKMEFFKLRRRLLMAVRGHKLLKDKNEGLLKEFLILVKAYKEARQKVDTDLPNHMKMFLLAQITSSSQNISTALEQSKGTLELKTLAKSILNIKVPVFEVSLTEDNSYSLIDTPTELDDAITQLKEFLPHIIRVAELEQSMRLLAKEIEKTRRRVNALEHVLIPQLQDSIKFIKSKLDEMERSNISRLMKIKEMLVSKTR
ncbi:MAG: V-type ATP synthase subunit D [Candidatus Brocadia sinica]|nr:V-type ATP synthase subunit D [Candidatus Brocadia sinica]NUO06222.1 V-type ATP synthase subunit D [Candidatus Brocadia sinica]